MTHNQEPVVTQADRDAAADWCAAQPFPSKQAEAPMIRGGTYDHHSLVQAFASHRLASTSADGERVAQLEAENARLWKELEMVHQDLRYQPYRSTRTLTAIARIDTLLGATHAE